MGALSRSVLIRATPEQCYDVIWDFARYPEFQPEMKDVRVESDSGERAVVWFKASVIRQVEYVLEFRGGRPRGFTWVQRSGYFKRNSGGWDFKESAGSLTEATYTLDFQIPGLVPKAVVQKLTEVNFPKMLDTFKRRVESLAG
ncbi:MAG: SRPBCC family protein [Myxococcales bacterium]|nr:SRPBCC family protein [Myxococcales bacterium]